MPTKSTKKKEKLWKINKIHKPGNNQNKHSNMPKRNYTMTHIKNETKT